ncbi:MAG: sigma-70 family RNA polymerase sigma factor [Caldilineaceae bacterium]
MKSGRGFDGPCLPQDAGSHPQPPWRTSFSGWLYRIAHNLLVDHYRDCAKQTYVPLDDAPVLTTTQYNPVRIAESRLEIERLRAAIRRLTDDQALVISLRFIERCSINEVAEMLDKTEGAVKALQHRALATLHQLLENEELWEA